MNEKEKISLICLFSLTAICVLKVGLEGLFVLFLIFPMGGFGLIEID